MAKPHLPRRSARHSHDGEPAGEDREAMLAISPCRHAGGTHPDSCVIDVSVSPNAKRTEAIGLYDGALRIRLAAAPVDGQANAELVRWVAEELGLVQRSVQILRGLGGRRKQLLVTAPLAEVQAWIERLLAELRP